MIKKTKLVIITLQTIINKTTSKMILHLNMVIVSIEIQELSMKKMIILIQQMDIS